MILSKPITSIAFLLTCLLSFLTANGHSEENNLIDEKMISIPAGYFTMGSDENKKDEAPSHQVYLDGYFIDQHEVSNAEYGLFLNSTEYEKPKYWNHPYFNSPDQPVVGVSWKDASSYAKWLNKRLPTEAEWEKTARGQDSRKWPWGNSWGENHKYFYLNLFGILDNYEFTSPTDYYDAGMSPYSALNMGGNVWEWCSDWYDENYYNNKVIINPKGPKTGKMKVLRGGSWINTIKDARTSRRIRNYPDVRLSFYGFRCALDKTE